TISFTTSIKKTATPRILEVLGSPHRDGMLWLMIDSSQPAAKRLFRVLSLDGGGTKGVYTLGVRKEVEAIDKVPLCEVFDLVFGTSTGSIIAALIASGKSRR